MQTVTVEDKTSAVVVCHIPDTRWDTAVASSVTTVLCRPSWSPAAATKEALIWLAEQGDVQSAVSTEKFSKLYTPIVRFGEKLPDCLCVTLLLCCGGKSSPGAILTDLHTSATHLLLAPLSLYRR